MDKTTVITGFAGGLHACLGKKLRRKLRYTSQVAYYTSTNFLCIHAHTIRDLDGGTARRLAPLENCWMEMTFTEHILSSFSLYLSHFAGQIKKTSRISLMTRGSS
jgi:hypothetical protein